MKRAPLLLTLALLSLTPVCAAERTIAVVLDRSASLRHGDPDGRGPKLLAMALALSTQAGERLAIYPTGGEPVEPAGVTPDPASLAPLLAKVLSSAPTPGGADLTAALDRALSDVGEGGLVLLYTDDDLDVVGADGNVPPAVMRKALESSASPTRSEVNHAAAALLEARVAEAKAVRFLALRSPLPSAARQTPFLKALRAKVVELEGDDLDVVAGLADGLRGEPIVSHEMTVARGSDGFELPFPARVVVRSSDGFALEDGVSLDGERRRLWIADARGAPVSVRAASEPLRCLVSPRLEFSGEVKAYGLKNGDVRVVAVGEGLPAAGDATDRLVLRYGREQTPLAGSPLAATLQVGVIPEEVTVLRLLQQPGGKEVVAAKRTVPVTRPELVLPAPSGAQVGMPLELSAPAPPGLGLTSLAIEIREASGALHQVDMLEDEGRLRVTITPQSPGVLQVRSQGQLPVRVDGFIDVLPGVRRLLSFESLSADGSELGGPHALALRSDGTKLWVVVACEPEPPQPISFQLRLSNAPEGARLEPSGPFTLLDRRELELTLHWPSDAESRELALRAEAIAGAAAPTTRSFRVEPPPARWRAIVAGVLILLALLWCGRIYGKRRKRSRYVDRVLSDKQLRTIGRNGRLSHERYRLRDFVGADLSIVVEPEDSPGGALSFSVRDDGTVTAEGQDGAKLVHADRPTVLANKLVLTHGTPFAMVHGHGALRYVYLEDEPDGDELTKEFLADQGSYDEAAARESGLYLIVDEESLQNIPRYSARLDASQEEIFPVNEEIFDSSSEVGIIPSNDPDADPLMSDEGILFMDSAEGEILDSQEVEFLDSAITQRDLMREDVEELSDEKKVVDSQDDEGRQSDAIKLEDLMGDD